jgi:fatty-acyl-CoA synthase
LPNPEALTAFRILADHYQNQPDRICIHLLRADFSDEEVTYRGLMQSAAGYARLYAETGIEPGEVIILILTHGMDLIGAFWGAILHGTIPAIMPFLTEKLLPERYRRDLAALVEVTRPAAVVTYPDFMAEIRGAVEKPGSSVRRVLLSSQAQIEPEPDLRGLMGSQRRPDDIVFLQHSSGTTGLQKGVAITHQALLNQLRSYGQAIHLTREDRIVSWLPLYHDMGLIAGFLLPILEGVPLALMSPFDWVKSPVRLMQAVDRYRGTLTWLPNFAFNFCAQKIRDSQLMGVDLSSWRAVINCSEPMSAQSFELFARRFGPYGFAPTALATSYAMAENVFGVTQGGIDRPVSVDKVDVVALQSERIARAAVAGQPSIEMLSCGKPIDQTHVKVIDVDGRPLPERSVGELAIQSDCMLAEYYNRPEETARALSGGWYLTGDYGYIAGEEVYVTGRKKDLIIVGGRNIFPQDIEAAAGETPGIHPGRVVAFGVYNEDMGTEEVALVAEVDLPEEQIGDPLYSQPIEDAVRLAVNRNTAVSLKYIQLVGPHWLVKTSSGKIARSANRERYLLEFRSEYKPSQDG